MVMATSPSTRAAIDALVADLELDGAGAVRAALARVLASRLDECDSAGQAAQASKELRAVLDTLVAAESADSDLLATIFGGEE